MLPLYGGIIIVVGGEVVGGYLSRMYDRFSLPQPTPHDLVFRAVTFELFLDGIAAVFARRMPM